ncbi:MAG: DUF4382 domain-containing protein [Gammaproteobacteria bacterium]|nr:DUF4382 domain-containing protein [Gammaproteobacteria bacterium]
MASTCTNSFRFLPALLLAACGGSGGGSSGMGSVSLSITDTPVDGADEVWVQFESIELKPKNGRAITFDFATPLSVDLKALTGDNTEILLNNEQVPAGEYNWIRLIVNASFDNILDSYVVTDTGQHVELRVPSGEVKLVSGFTVIQGGEASFLIDWNLRMGLTAPPGQSGYLLKPATRIIDLQEYGGIAGTVATGLITDPSCTADLNSGEGNEVYVFAGGGVTPDDVDGVAPEPLTTARVLLNEGTGNYGYKVPFLAPGTYTVAFTCQARNDVTPDPLVPPPDPAADNVLAFTPGANATVTNNQTVTVNFPGPG